MTLRSSSNVGLWEESCGLGKVWGGGWFKARPLSQVSLASAEVSQL